MWKEIKKGLETWRRLGTNEIEYVGWLHAPSEDMREELQSLGVRGEMRWSQEVSGFGTFSHCTMDRYDLEWLYRWTDRGDLDLYIGGFTGVWKGTDVQVPRKRQYFWQQKWHRNPAFYTDRHNAYWNHDSGKYIEGKEPEQKCPHCGVSVCA